MISSRLVKKHYNDTLTGKKYLCDYVVMEFLRGYIKNVVEFYLVLTVPSIESVDEALDFWSNNFKSRSLKDILKMMSNLLQTHSCINDKLKAKRVIAEYVRTMTGKLNNSFVRIGDDNTYCEKSKVVIDYNPEDLDETMRHYHESLVDKKHANHCHVNVFFKDKHLIETNKIVNESSGYAFATNSSRDGYDRLVEALADFMSKNKAMTCASCTAIGDVAISLLSKKDWLLEHSDYSFDYLCEILGKNHRLHPNDAVIIKTSATNYEEQ